MDWNELFFILLIIMTVIFQIFKNVKKQFETPDGGKMEEPPTEKPGKAIYEDLSYSPITEKKKQEVTPDKTTIERILETEPDEYDGENQVDFDLKKAIIYSEILKRPDY